MTKLFAQRPDCETRQQTDDSGTMHWLVDDSIVAGAALSVARMTLRPGASSRAHRHPNCDEVLHVIAGALEQTVGAERFTMEAGDTAFIPRGSVHQSRNIGAGEATMIVSYSAGARIYEPQDE